MDDVDRAQHICDAHLLQALARRREGRRLRDASPFCVACGDDIPAGRQKAVVTDLCIDCAQDIETHRSAA